MVKETDSLFKNKVHNSLIISENGKNMLQFAAIVEPVKQFNTNYNLFFLKYPGFKDKEWVKTPKNLLGTDSIVSPYNYMHYPNNATTLVYSAPDTAGVWNIYSIEKLNDTTWSAPALLNENITTGGNEVYPYLSADKKHLYFASNGHFGMGGYDLYCSEWDEDLNDWGIPQNIGFPYCSVGNDYLYYNTPDGIFTIFASDRASGSTSEVTLYTVLFDATPLKQHIEQEDALEASLLKTKEEKKNTTQPAAQSDDSEYAKVCEDIRRLQNTLAQQTEQLVKKREEYSNLTDSIAKIKLAEEISAKELESLDIEGKINAATQQLNEIEMDFLSKGIIIGGQEEQEQTQSVQITDYNFEYADNSIGNSPVLNVMAPEPEVDLNFKILPTAVMASLDDIPDGLVYQVQLCVLSKPATLKALKGMSPVFERKSSTGKYTYTAGVFYKYQDVLKALYRIRKNGFPGALINAYENGEYILVKKALAIEKENKTNLSYRIVLSGYDTLPEDALKIIKEHTSKDLAKTTANGVTEYIVGPFNQKEDADKLINALLEANIKNTRIESINKK